MLLMLAGRLLTLPTPRPTPRPPPLFVALQQGLQDRLAEERSDLSPLLRREPRSLGGAALAPGAEYRLAPAAFMAQWRAYMAQVCTLLCALGLGAGLPAGLAAALRRCMPWRDRLPAPAAPAARRRASAPWAQQARQTR